MSTSLAVAGEEYYREVQAVLYEYPPKLTRQARQQKALHDLEEHRKMRRTMYKNLILGGIIIVIGIIAPNVIVKMILILLGLANIAVGGLLYWYFAYYRTADVYTRIFDDHIEHSQRKGLSGDYLEVSIFYDEVGKSWQTNSGLMVFELSEVTKSQFMIRHKNGSTEKLSPPDKCELSFQDTGAKLYLIEKLWEQIKYPHKEYNVIDDDDDYYSKEDIEWDKLHKHGL